MGNHHVDTLCKGVDVVSGSGWVLEGFLWNRNPKGDGIRIVRELLAAGASDENLRQRMESDDAENPAMRELIAALGR